MKKVIAPLAVLAFAFSSLSYGQSRVTGIKQGDAKRVPMVRALGMNGITAQTNDPNWYGIWAPAINDLAPRFFRVQFKWELIETSQDNFEWDDYDEMMRRLHNLNIPPRILGQLHEAPAWSMTGGNNTGPPDNVADFADTNGGTQDFVSEIVARYMPGGSFALSEGWTDGYGVYDWEIRNEVNQQAEPACRIEADCPCNFLWTPTIYKNNLNAAYDAIKALDSDANVVISSFSDPGLSCISDPKTFLRALYAAGIAGHFDIMNAHPYDETNCDFTVHELPPIRRVMCQQGATECSKPMWLTEYGKSTGGHTALQNCYTEMAYYHTYDQMFWFSLTDDSDDIFGLMLRGGNCNTAGGGDWTKYFDATPELPSESPTGCRAEFGMGGLSIYDTFRDGIRH